MVLKIKAVGFEPTKVSHLKTNGYYNIEVNEPFTANDLLIFFGYENYPAMVVNVNGNVAENDRKLSEDDYIMLMHAVYGG